MIHQTLHVGYSAVWSDQYDLLNAFFFRLPSFSFFAFSLLKGFVCLACSLLAGNSKLH